MQFLLSRKNINIFLILVVVQAGFLLVSDYLLIDDSLFYDALSEKLSHERITKAIEESKQWKWLTYALIPLIILARCLFVSTCIFIGTFFAKKEVEQFSVFFKVTLIAEFVMLLPLVTGIVWFGFIHRNYTLDEMSNFAPLSIYQFVQHGEVEKWLVYPLKLLNLFEVAFWVILAQLLKITIDKSFGNRLFFVASTYGLGLFLWVVLIVFLTVSIS